MSKDPVAWGVFEGTLHDMFFTQEEAQEMARLKGSHAKVNPLYTILPEQPTKIFGPNLEELLNGAGFYKKKDWVGLTDEEIMEMLNYGQYGRVPQYARNFVDAIEAKLKDKNNG